VSRAYARGQTLVLFSLTMLLITLMVCLTLSFSMKIRDKMEAQHVADLAAYSSAVATARTFNSIALMRRAQTGHLVAMSGVQSLISWTSMMRANLNATRVAAAGCPAAAAVLQELNEENAEIEAKWHELDAKAGIQAYNIQILGGHLRGMQEKMYEDLVKAVSGGPESFATQLSTMASEGARFPTELKGGPTAVSAGELEHATSDGNSFGLDMAMASRGYEFITRRQGMPLFDGNHGVLGVLHAAGATVNVIEGGGSAYWGSALGHGGRADQADYTWAEDHAELEVQFPGCGPFQVNATAGVKSTDMADEGDDHWWTPEGPRLGDQDVGLEKQFRHTLGPVDPLYAPSTFIGGFTYNTGDTNPGNNWAQPKLFALVQRDYKVRGMNADPWNLFFTFRFTPDATRQFDSNGWFLADGTDISVQQALGTGLAYYHRRGHWEEPPSLWNPFWRATLASADVDGSGVADAQATIGATAGAALQQLVSAGYKGMH
jgi:hypothetical protein